MSAYLPMVTMQVRRKLRERAALVLAISGIQEIVQRIRDPDRKAKAVVIVEVQVTDLVVAATVVAQVIARKAIALAAVLAQALVLREIIAAAPDIDRKEMLTAQDVLMDHRHHLIHLLVAAKHATAVRARARIALLVKVVSAAKAQAVGVTKLDAPIAVAPNLAVAQEAPGHSIVQVRRARAEVRVAEPVPVARSLVLALVHQVRHRAHLAHHQAVVNAAHTAVGRLVVAHLVPADLLVLADHLVLADREAVVEHSQAVDHSRVVAAAHVANRVQPVDPELVVDRLAAVVHAQAVAAQENQELVELHLVVLHTEESLSLVAPAVHRVAVAMIEAVSRKLSAA